MNEIQVHLENTFLGRYQFHRTVSSPLLMYEGSASFVSRAPGRVRYVEEGSYNRGNDIQETYQQREFRLEKDGFFVLKTDGSILHRFDYKEELCKSFFPFSFSHTHVCKNDLYHCTLFLESPNRFSTHYTINGPEKDYEIKTVYERSNS